MARIIPNQNSWIGFSTTRPASLSAPTKTEIEAVGVKNLTPFVISITANAQGNTIPTPALDSLFETSVPGTSTATFTADFYRDDTTDTAWTELTRGLKGYFYISRFGGRGTNSRPTYASSTGDAVEVWPVIITSRAAGPMTSNTAQTFTITCAVPEEPAENATVAAAGGGS